MTMTAVGRCVRLFLACCALFLPRVINANGALTLSTVEIIGTDRLSTDDLVRGLKLKVGGPTRRQDLQRACDQFKQLKLFESSRCSCHIREQNISLTIFVKDQHRGMRVVFDNFVWISRAELLTRLKHDLPLFMPILPQSSSLNNDIVRVLDQVVAEHGIKAHVAYDDHFWVERGMNVFYIEKFSTPIISLQIEGENAPAPDEFRKWAQFCTKENFSAARLTWVTDWVIRDFYHTRGHLRVFVGEPIVQSLGEKDGAYPVSVTLRVTSGDLYRFQSVRFEGLAKARTDSLLPQWKLKPGDPYNQRYVDDFIESVILRAPWAQYSTVQSDSAEVCTNIEEASYQVSVTIKLEAPKKKSQGCNGIPSSHGIITFSSSDMH